MTTTRRPWPANANGARKKAMSNDEEIARISRALLDHPDIRGNDHLEAKLTRIWALAEESRRELGEARP